MSSSSKKTKGMKNAARQTPSPKKKAIVIETPDSDFIVKKKPRIKGKKTSSQKKADCVPSNIEKALCDTLNDIPDIEEEEGTKKHEMIDNIECKMCERLIDRNSYSSHINICVDHHMKTQGLKALRKFEMKPTTSTAPTVVSSSYFKTEENKGKILCPICNKDLSRLAEKSRDAHANRCVLEQPKIITKRTFYCPICTKPVNFKQQAGFTRHLRTCMKKSAVSTEYLMEMAKTSNQDENMDVIQKAIEQSELQHENEQNKMPAPEQPNEKKRKKGKSKKKKPSADEELMKLAKAVSKNEQIDVLGRRTKKTGKPFPAMLELSQSSKKSALDDRLDFIKAESAADNSDMIPCTPLLPGIKTEKYEAVTVRNVNLDADTKDDLMTGSMPASKLKVKSLSSNWLKSHLNPDEDEYKSAGILSQFELSNGGNAPETSLQDIDPAQLKDSDEFLLPSETNIKIKLSNKANGNYNVEPQTDEGTIDLETDHENENRFTTEEDTVAEVTEGEADVRVRISSDKESEAACANELMSGAESEGEEFNNGDNINLRLYSSQEKRDEINKFSNASDPLRQKWLNKFSNDLRNLINEPAFSDCIILFNDSKKMHIHKVILSTRCPELLKKIELKNVENETYEMDCRMIEFQPFIEYLYTGNLDAYPKPDVTKEEAQEYVMMFAEKFSVAIPSLEPEVVEETQDFPFSPYPTEQYRYSPMVGREYTSTPAHHDGGMVSDTDLFDSPAASPNPTSDHHEDEGSFIAKDVEADSSVNEINPSPAKPKRKKSNIKIKKKSSTNNSYQSTPVSTNIRANKRRSENNLSQNPGKHARISKECPSGSESDITEKIILNSKTRLPRIGGTTIRTFRPTKTNSSKKAKNSKLLNSTFDVSETFNSPTVEFNDDSSVFTNSDLNVLSLMKHEIRDRSCMSDPEPELPSFNSGPCKEVRSRSGRRLSKPSYFSSTQQGKTSAVKTKRQYTFKNSNKAYDSPITPLTGKFDRSLASKFKTPTMRRLTGGGGGPPMTPMANFSDMDTPELIKEGKKIGLKNMNKKKTKKKLKEVHLYTHQIETPEKISEEVMTDVIHIESEDSIASSDEEIYNSQENLQRTLFAPLIDTEDLSSTQSSEDKFPLSLMDRIQRKKQPKVVEPRTSLSQPVHPSCEEIISKPAKIKPKKLTQDELYELIHRVISTNKAMYENILQYKPIYLTDVKQLLLANGIRKSTDTILDFLDHKCITFSTANERKEIRAKPRKRRK